MNSIAASPDPRLSEAELGDTKRGGAWRPDSVMLDGMVNARRFRANIVRVCRAAGQHRGSVGSNTGGELKGIFSVRGTYELLERG